VLVGDVCDDMLTGGMQAEFSGCFQRNSAGKDNKGNEPMKN